MLFNSYIFMMFFLPLSLFGYFGLNKKKEYTKAKVFLVLMSFWFYGYFSPGYILIIFSSICVNYYVGCKLLENNDGEQRNVLFYSGLLFNIGLLFYFKYLNFTLENINLLLQSNLLLSDIALPLGISFFTFQQLSFLIDCHRRCVPPYAFLDYALFVTFFPQLIAGPIVLHSEMVPQFADESKKQLNDSYFAKGLYAFSLGMSKKVLIADSFAHVVNWGYDNLDVLSGVDGCLVALAYTFQIYFDFSGYCDIATGIALMFHLKIPMNFNSPYKSKNILDFWKRWHITLTRFLTTYLYHPLGGSNYGNFLTYRNIMIVFIISGIWHGANWTFVIWGLLHGSASVIVRIFQKMSITLPSIFSWYLQFLFINFCWIFFRATSLADAFSLIETIVTGGYTAIHSSMIQAATASFEFECIHVLGGVFGVETLAFLGCYAVTLLCVLFLKNTNEKVDSFRPNYPTMFFTAFLLLWNLLSFAGVSQFIYFDF